MSDALDDVRLDRRGALGHIHLNRPKALNTLTHAMVIEINQALVRWKDDPEVLAVLVTGEGDRAFCAGGDVRAVTAQARDEGVGVAHRFFHDEYLMNWRIGRFPKPYVALIDGITMGGGVGLSVHGTFRIATERTLLAMPETTIGLFPDVGASYALPRCPGSIGLYLGLTGERLTGGDVVHAGLATHFMASEQVGALIDQLEAIETPDNVSSVIEGHGAYAPSGTLVERRDAIDRVFERYDLEFIRDGLEAEPTGWGAALWREMTTKSPTSVYLTLEELNRGRALDFEACLRQEFRMVYHCLGQPDFAEGVRALLVDKDKTPKWRPDRLEDVRQEAVGAFFEADPGYDLVLGWRANTSGRGA